MTLEVPLWGLIVVSLPIIITYVYRSGRTEQKLEDVVKAINGSPQRIAILETKMDNVISDVAEVKETVKYIKAELK